MKVMVARVKASGKRFLFLRKEGKKVRVKGEVSSVSGCSSQHGPDKLFLATAVEITEEVFGPELLLSLLDETTIRPAIHIRKPPARKRWAKRLRLGRGDYWELTDHARKQLEAEGYDIAMDGLGNYLDEDTLSDAAMDGAAYHSELTADGVPEGYMPGAREAAADYIYEGMQRALKEKRKAGKRTTLEAQ